MVEALRREMMLQAAGGFISENTIHTIYFGGGTPSLLTGSEVNLLLQQVRQLWQVAADAEVTLEANPDDITPGILAEWKEGGINRLSVGLQSLHNTELKWMNRAHTAEESLEAVARCKAAGFDRLNVDLMYGSPLLSDADWAATLEWATAQKIGHLSCYALTVEPKTPLEKKIRTGKSAPVVPESQARQFELLVQTLRAAGYRHYEISNFALPEQESRHNSSYWQGTPYWGIGPSAHSFNQRIRRWNRAHNQHYIQAIEQGILPYEEEILTETQQFNEYVMIALRLENGCSLEVVAARFGTEKMQHLLQQAQRYLQQGQLEQKNNHLIVTPSGKLFADGIAADLFMDA